MSFESGHYYDRSGLPCHTQPTKPGAKNPTRATTVSDAKKLGLLPSVSGITRMMASPGLENYKLRQVAEECYNRPPIGDESLRDYQSYVLDKAGQPARDAADFGTVVHAAIEAVLAGKVWSGPETATYPSTGQQMPVKAIIQPVIDLLGAKGVSVRHTERVLTHQMGYAGTTDLVGSRDRMTTICDFKTKADWTDADLKRGLAYDEHGMQLAAYANGLPLYPQRLINVFISTDSPGKYHVHEWPANDHDRLWRQFLHLLAYWQLSNGVPCPA